MYISRLVTNASLWLMLIAPSLVSADTILFVNRCPGNCQFSGGPDSAVNNTTTIIDSNRTLTAFSGTDNTFNSVVECIAGLVAPFGIAVTTSDPSPQLHTEMVLAGTPEQFLLPGGVQGIAPFTCNLVANAPAFVFANDLGTDVELMCYTAAAQLGSLAGLEPLHNCLDVMSYLSDCGERSYRNEVSSCGTFSAAPCMCGGTTRNSFAVMRNIFGPAEGVFEDGFETQP